MRVRGQGLPQAQFAHEREARAIGKRKIVIAVAKKDRGSPAHQPALFPSASSAGALGAFVVNAFLPHPQSLGHALPPSLRGREIEAKPDERERFIDDVIGGEQQSFAFEPLVPGGAGRAMGGIGCVRASHPAGGVHEQVFHPP